MKISHEIMYGITLKIKFEYFFDLFLFELQYIPLSNVMTSKQKLTELLFKFLDIKAYEQRAKIDLPNPYTNAILLPS